MDGFRRVKLDDLKARLLAHRGAWSRDSAPNSLQAIHNAFLAGFGVETDIRDSRGAVCISHDPIGQDSLHLKEVLSNIQQSSDSGCPIVALNVKSDGLAPLLHDLRESLVGFDYFFFDMSVPQILEYHRYQLPVASRLSEIEPLMGIDAGQEHPDRIWLDAFYTDWWMDDDTVLSTILDVPTVIVSPELHDRDPRNVWDMFGELLQRRGKVALCTDQPDLVLRHLC